jgi:MFS family permease
MPLWMVRGWGISYMQAGWITALFAPAMWIPGVFNSYLIDAFPRKSVALWGVLGCVAATVGMLYAESLWIVAALRVVQGMAFAVAIMAIGSTLAIDAAPSNRRSDSNTAFVWIARVGMAVGLLAGLLLYAYEGLESVWTVSAALGALALLCIPMVSVPFRAPLHAPLCTLDRFFLPRAWMPMCNLVGVVLVAGVVNSCLYEPMAYAMLIVGIVLAWAFSRWVLPGMPKRAAVELGQAAIIGGLLLLGFVGGLPAQCIGALLTAMGVCFSSSYLFTTMIDLARHCERGSAVHSYHLLWELGMMAGVVVATSVSIGAIDFLYMIAIVVSLVVLGLFEGVTHPFKNV